MDFDKIKDTIDKLGKTVKLFKDENDKRLDAIEKKGYAPADLTEKVDKINGQVSKLEGLKAQLDSMETAMARLQLPGGGIVTEKDKAKAEHSKAFSNYFRKGEEGGLRALEIQANLSTLSDPDGGFTVPEEVESAIDRVAMTVSAMRRIARKIVISTDTYKRLISQGGAASGWVGEKGSRAETDTPTLKQIAFNAKEIYANPAATQNLLDDSRVNIAQWLGDEVSIEFTEQEGDAFINGNGVEKPRGFQNYTKIANASYSWGNIGFTVSGHATLINDPDAVVDLHHSLKSIYRNGASYLMADLTFAAIRKLKDGNGAYIWRPGLELGAPSTLLGKPVEIDDNMPAIGAGLYPIAFGNWQRGYLIVDRQGIRVLRDPYTNKPFIHFYTTKRVGGGVTHYEAIKLLKVSA